MIYSTKAIQRIAQLLFPRQRAVAEEPCPSAGARKVDEVTLSPECRELQALQKRLAETEDVRTERVQKLRETIAKGEYHVPAEKIAERIIEEGRLEDLD